METRKRMVIDLLSGANPDCVHTVQGDAYSRVVELELKAGRQNWPVPEDASVLVEYVKSDGTKGVYDTLPDGSAAWSAEGNVLSLTLAPQMLTVSGTVAAQVRLIQGERLLSLFAFRIYVHNKLAGGETSEDYFSWRAQYLPQTLGAAVGQWLKAAQVDEQGRVLAVETADAPDGGYYTPGVTQPDSSTMEVAFAPSDEAMPALPPVRVTLPPGPPRNWMDNSDFTRFVAQAGIGGLHGTQAYAGCRWILDIGTVTGTANADGDGYSDIALNGTIRQKVAHAPAVATAGIEMISGTATIEYNDGEVTITSDGGVIKAAKLFAGEYTSGTMPEHQPKGYAAELLECQRYYREFGTWRPFATGYTDYLGILQFTIPVSTQFRTAPTASTLAGACVVIDGHLYTIPEGVTPVVVNSDANAVHFNLYDQYRLTTHLRQPFVLFTQDAPFTLSAEG